MYIFKFGYFEEESNKDLANNPQENDAGIFFSFWYDPKYTDSVILNKKREFSTTGEIKHNVALWQPWRWLFQAID